MTYAELIARSIINATNSPDSMLPVFKQAVLDAAVKDGHKLEETDLLDEVPDAEEKLAALLRNKKRLVAMLDAFLPEGAPSLAAQGAMLAQIEAANATMQQPGYVPPLLKPKATGWAPLRMFQRKGGR